MLTRKDVSVINGELEHLCGSRDLHPCLVQGPLVVFNVVPFCSRHVVSK